MAMGRQSCFVIMPFNETTDEHTEAYWTRHFKSFLKPLIEENPDLEARRSEALRGDIVRQIITALVVSQVVVADLTDDNPNVYWELGIRQSFKHGTVTIAEVGRRLPFDISTKGTLLYYPKDHLKMEDFRQAFREAIRDCLASPDRPDSCVLEAVSGRGTLFEILHRDEAVRRLDAVLSEWEANSNILEDVVKAAATNQKDPKRRTFVTGRFKKAAIELLVTERYVDEDESFFKFTDNCLSWVDSLNAQLDAWASEPDSVELWLLKTGKVPAALIGELRAKIARARDELRRRL